MCYFGPLSHNFPLPPLFQTLVTALKVYLNCLYYEKVYQYLLRSKCNQHVPSARCIETHHWEKIRKYLRHYSILFFIIRKPDNFTSKDSAPANNLLPEDLNVSVLVSHITSMTGLSAWLIKWPFHFTYTPRAALLMSTSSCFLNLFTNLPVSEKRKLLRKRHLYWTLKYWSNSNSSSMFVIPPSWNWRKTFIQQKSTFLLKLQARLPNIAIVVVQQKFFGPKNGLCTWFTCIQN